ncbi:MAG: ATP-binding protein [Acidobacteria bacterium]|nr:ATP-binding protein [Acidobacteriota bacterium]
MTENPYQVFGTTPALMLGRKGTWGTIMRRLDKPKPDHVSVIGPALIGKTILLNALTARLNQDKNLFDACIYWDVRRSRIESDADFYQGLVEQAVPAVATLDSGLASDLRADGGGNYSVLKDVFEYLNEDGRKILLVMDELDLVLMASGVTRNLWDNLRSLAEKPGLRLMTGSRKPLRELCNSQDSRTSDFWNIFYPQPIRVEVFSEDDWRDVLVPFAQRQIQFERGADTEIMNWTGGVPALAAALCEKLWEVSQDGVVISREQVNQVADVYFASDETILPSLWKECDADEQGDLHEIAQGKILTLNQHVPQLRYQSLTRKGYVVEQKGSLKPYCRAMENYAKLHGSDATGMRRLFGSAEDYEKNLRGLLELRLSQIQITDNDLRLRITNAIQFLDSSPSITLQQIRGIVDDAFNMIWASEIPDRKIPEKWSEIWLYSGYDNPPAGRIPDGAKRCQLINLMTESRTAVETKVSRATYFLIDSLQAYGDFGQHMQGEKVSASYVAMVCLNALELCARLSIELNATK